MITTTISDFRKDIKKYQTPVNKKWLIDNNEVPVSGNRIVLGVTLPAVSYQPREFGASQVITAKANWLNEKNGIFISIASKARSYLPFRSFSNKKSITCVTFASSPCTTYLPFTTTAGTPVSWYCCAN